MNFAGEEPHGGQDKVRTVKVPTTHASRSIFTPTTRPFSPTLTYNIMVDNASGQPDRSIQVKLVLLGTSFENRPDCFPMFHTSLLTFHNPPGEAAVGKSSVVLRFVRVWSFGMPPFYPLTCSTSPPGLE
jgi:hypothetical protein